MTVEMAFAIMWVCNALAFATLVMQIRGTILEWRAARRLVRVLAERDEYRPMLKRLFELSGRSETALEFSEYEEVALRDRVRAALVHLSPADRRRVERELFAPIVAERANFLRSVLSASIWRVQHQA